MPNHDKYLTSTHRLRRRYAQPTGELIVQVGGRFTRYALLEDMAAVKYLGCDINRTRLRGLGVNVRGVSV